MKPIARVSAIARRRRFARFLSHAALALSAARLLSAEPVVIRLGTILPSGTSQHAALQELGERWRKDSAGAVKLILYPDGRLGGETEMIKKLRIKQLNAGLFSAVGLAEIDPSARGLQVMPLMFRSWAEVDYVRERVRPQLEARLRAKGYEVLFWADAGWVRFFSKTAAVRPDDFRPLKMFAWVGDPAQLDLMRSMRCTPVPLETTDILLGLNTDRIETVAVPPLVALASQVNRPAPHLLELNWAPIVGAIVVRTDVWEKNARPPRQRRRHRRKNPRPRPPGKRRRHPRHAGPRTATPSAHARRRRRVAATRRRPLPAHPRRHGPRRNLRRRATPPPRIPRQPDRFPPVSAAAFAPSAGLKSSAHSSHPPPSPSPTNPPPPRRPTPVTM